jgi:hypothetical protein
MTDTPFAQIRIIIILSLSLVIGKYDDSHAVINRERGAAPLSAMGVLVKE